MMPNIRIDDEVYKYINDRGKTEDTFNDVLRREFGLESAKKRLDELPTNEAGTLEYSEDEYQMVEVLMEQKFPALNNPVHKHQLVKWVLYYLLLPVDWTVKNRSISAAKLLAKEEGVTRETIQDGGTRRLKLNIAEFRKKLEDFEKVYFKKGDKVKFIKSSMYDSFALRQGEVGTVVNAYHKLPAQGVPKVDIEFADGKKVPGFSIYQIEHAQS